MTDLQEPVSVYRVKEPAHAEVIKSALEAEGIRCHIGGPNQGALTGVFDIDILVAAADADRARRFIEQHEEGRAAE